jgi:hypothetical protein
MKLLSLITPKFLKNLDNYFLLNHRLLWITKVHYVLYYGIIATLMGAALIWAYPLYPSSVLPDGSAVLFFAILLALPPAIFWVYKQATYNIEKSYGRLFPFIEQFRFGIYLVCFAVFGGLPVLFTMLIEQKVANLETLEQLGKDTYILNAGNPYFPTHQNGDVLWEEDKSMIQNADNNYQFPAMADGRNYYNFSFFYVDFDYTKPYTNRQDTHLYFHKLFLNTHNDAQRLALIKDYISVFNKYNSRKIELSPEEVLKNHKEHKISSFDFYADKYGPSQKQEINSRLYKISHIRQYPIMRNSSDLVVWATMIFCLSTLLLIFQNVKWQDFVLAAVSFGVGAFIYGGSLAFMSSALGESNESLVLVGILGAFAFFIFKSLQINHIQAFSRFKIFVLMFANVMSPFMLLCAVTWLGKAFGGPYYYMDSEEAKWLLVVGMVAHTIVLMPFFRKMYLRMRALPRG